MTSPITVPPTSRASPGRDYIAAAYGSLLVTTLLAVEWRGEPSVTLIGLSLIASVVVFWLTHVWAAIVDRRVRGPVATPEIIALAGHQAPMLASAIVPALLLALAPLGLVSLDGALAAALVASVAQLFLWGLAVGRAAHTRWLFALVVAAVDCSLGVIIVVVKGAVIH